MTAEVEPPELGGRSAQDILQWAWSTFGTDAVFTSSFGAEDMVLMDMLGRGNIGVKIATIDTGRLPQETYDIMDQAAEKYGVDIEKYFPNYAEVEEMVNDKGVNLFYNSPENRKLCCSIRKVQPLNRILGGKKAWITGLRSDQTAFRKKAKVVEEDRNRGIIKINPILGWSSEDVWNYIRENGVPYNTLHDQGFPSIGCQPCTRAVKPGENERSGRWWWETELKECGLHVSGSDASEKPHFTLKSSESKGGR